VASRWSFGIPDPEKLPDVEDHHHEQASHLDSDLAPIAASKRWLACSTTAGQPFWASLRSQTVIVLPLPSTLGTLSSLPLLLVLDEDLLELPALTAMARDAARTTAPASLRFTPVS